MNITSNLVIKHEPNRYEPDKPYILFIVNHGRVGDKFNADTNNNHSTWPVNSSERFETFQEAAKAHAAFLRYVENKIREVQKKGSSGKASYYLWS